MENQNDENKNIIFVYSSYTPSQKKAIYKYKQNPEKKEMIKKNRNENYLKKKEDPRYVEKKRRQARESYYRRKELKKISDCEIKIEETEQNI
jgi:hypothetical protein